MRNPLVNIRFGFAANSSSSHSIIFIDKDHKLSDDYDALDFGWNSFVLASKEAKLDYLSIILTECLTRNKLPDRMIESIVKDWTGSVGSLEGYIDHQSAIRLPNKNKHVDIDFFEDFKNFLCRDDIVILGGNDNQDRNLVDNIPHKGEIKFDFINLHDIYRKNKKTGVWTIFNPHSGNKLKFSFNDISNKEIEEKSDIPELVDIKITDYCPFGCSYCYQSSTALGKHAEFGVLKSVAGTLSKYGTFEIAIGGGEPTLYAGAVAVNYDKALDAKDFNDVIDLFYENGIVVNFTTRNLKWLEKLDPERAKKVGCIAFSIDKSHNISRIIDLESKNENLRGKIAIQYVVGISDEYNLENILKICGERNYKITLLGYKRFGFGNNFQPNNKEEENWMNVLVKVLETYKNLKISIDTVLAAYSMNQLDENGVPNFCYSTKDGINSMYIDAVNQKIARSSYDSESTSVDLNNYHSEHVILEKFQSWT